RSSVAPVLGTIAASLGLDGQGRLWAATTDEVLYLERDRFVRVPGLPGGNVWSIAPGRENTWVSVGLKGLYQRTAPNAVQEFPWGKFGKSIGAVALLPEPSLGGVWLGFVDGGVSHFKDGRVVTSYTPADGLGAGRVSDLRFGEHGTIWAATEGGLSRIRDGQEQTLTVRDGLPGDYGHWPIESQHQFNL